ncbi:MAG: hypothetical protein ACI9Y1_001649, partial [Lentisphaeria bacterium]
PLLSPSQAIILSDCLFALAHQLELDYADEIRSLKQAARNGSDNPQNLSADGNNGLIEQNNLDSGVTCNGWLYGWHSSMSTLFLINPSIFLTRCLRREGGQRDGGAGLTPINL